MGLLIEYKVKEEKIEEQQAAVITFVSLIKAMNDPEIEYVVYQLPDKVSFKHIVRLASEDAKIRLQSQEFFKMFAAEIEPRCVEQPRVTPLSLIASTHYKPE